MGGDFCDFNGVDEKDAILSSSEDMNIINLKNPDEHYFVVLEQFDSFMKTHCSYTIHEYFCLSSNLKYKELFFN